MADQLHFDLVAPERRVFSGKVDMVTAPGTEGDFGILPEHGPFMTALRPGAIGIHQGGSVDKVFIHGGFAEVTAAGLTILAEEAIPLSDVDKDQLAEALRSAREDLEDAGDEAERRIARERVEKLEALKTVLEAG